MELKKVEKDISELVRINVNFGSKFDFDYRFTRIVGQWVVGYILNYDTKYPAENGRYIDVMAAQWLIADGSCHVNGILDTEYDFEVLVDNN